MRVHYRQSQLKITACSWLLHSLFFQNSNCFIAWNNFLEQLRSVLFINFPIETMLIYSVPTSDCSTMWSQHLISRSQQNDLVRTLSTKFLVELEKIAHIKNLCESFWQRLHPFLCFFD